MTKSQLAKILTKELGLIESTEQDYKSTTSLSSHYTSGTYTKGGFIGGDFYIVKAEKNIFDIIFNDVDFMNKIKSDIEDVLSEYGKVKINPSGSVDLFVKS